MGCKSFLLLLFCITGITSCSKFSQNQFEFYYYPQKNIYYSLTDNQYLFSLNGGESWDSVQAFSSAPPATLGPREIIYSQSPAIYTQNSEHLQQFNGRVINITGFDTGYSNQHLTAERRARKTNTGTANNTETDKGAEKPGFFKRIFGKKNK